MVGEEEGKQGVMVGGGWKKPVFEEDAVGGMVGWLVGGWTGLRCSTGYPEKSIELNGPLCWVMIQS